MGMTLQNIIIIILFVCGYWGQCEQSKASLLAKLQHAEKLKIPKSQFSVAIIID